jgi:HSP20 family protein
MTAFPELKAFQDLERWFERDFVPMIPVWREVIPAANIYETKNEVVAELALPGIEAKDVDIEIENDVLSLKAESQKEEKQEERNYYRREIIQRSFSRTINLPVSVQAGKAKAQMKDGVLRVTIPKAESVKRKKIKVAVGNK